VRPNETSVGSGWIFFRRAFSFRWRRTSETAAFPIRTTGTTEAAAFTIATWTASTALAHEIAQSFRARSQLFFAQLAILVLIQAIKPRIAFTLGKSSKLFLVDTAISVRVNPTERLLASLRRRWTLTVWSASTTRWRRSLRTPFGWTAKTALSFRTSARATLTLTSLSNLSFINDPVAIGIQASKTLFSVLLAHIDVLLLADLTVVIGVSTFQETAAAITFLGGTLFLSAGKASHKHRQSGAAGEEFRCDFHGTIMGW
jgi:hypothetical protein